MSRTALDSNIILYAELEPESDKGKHAADLILRAAPAGVIPAQALGVFLRVVQRRAPATFSGAVRQAGLYRATFLVPPTTDQTIAHAADIAAGHGLQLWDAVICAAALQAGAQVLLTEDLQDGRLLERLRFINPFNPDNRAMVDEALGG